MTSDDKKAQFTTLRTTPGLATTRLVLLVVSVYVRARRENKAFHTKTTSTQPLNETTVLETIENVWNNYSTTT